MTTHGYGGLKWFTADTEQFSVTYVQMCGLFKLAFSSHG